MSSAGTAGVEQAPPPRDPAEIIAEPHRTLSIGEALHGNQNSLGLIRLILASVVIFDHAFPIGGFGEAPFWKLFNGQASLGGLAVAGFFAISGYLIAKSGMSGDVVQFMWRRTLRIFPAYWLVLLVTAFIVGPLLWLADGNAFGHYFNTAPGGPFYFITSNWTLNIGSYGINDLLADTTPYGRRIGSSALNGSIWTLIYEWNCYLIIAVLVLFGVMKNARIVVPLIAAFFFIMEIVLVTNPGNVQALAPTGVDQYTISLGMTFLAGSVLAVYSRKVPFDHRLGILAGLVFLLSLHYGGFATFGTLAGVYFVIYLAAALPRQVQWIGQKNDYSYGIYIYGFLVEQVIAYLGWYKLGYFPYVAIALVLTFMCAWLSWHLVEKRAMKLKNWGPGRGFAHWRAWLNARFSKKTIKE